jgi:hypothetical protein
MNYKKIFDKKTRLFLMLLTVVFSLTMVDIFTSAASALTQSTTQRTACSGNTCATRTTTCVNGGCKTTTTSGSTNNFALNICINDVCGTTTT